MDTLALCIGPVDGSIGPHITRIVGKKTAWVIQVGTAIGVQQRSSPQSNGGALKFDKRIIDNYGK
jgi:hypothetical protein